MNFFTTNNCWPYILTVGPIVLAIAAWTSMHRR